MPNYEFCCINCNMYKEKNLPVDKRDGSDIMCDSCGYHMIRVLSAPSIQFKGSGFYSTGG